MASALERIRKRRAFYKERFEKQKASVEARKNREYQRSHVKRESAILREEMKADLLNEVFAESETVEQRLSALAQAKKVKAEAKRLMQNEKAKLYQRQKYVPVKPRDLDAEKRAEEERKSQARLMSYRPPDENGVYWWEKDLKWAQISNLPKLKSSWYFHDMIKEGYVPYTKEWRNESQRRSKKKHRSLYPEREKEAQKKKNEKRRRQRLENLEAQRERERKWAAAKRARRKDEINARQRARYQRNAGVESLKQLERRHLRQPHRAIRAYTKLYSEGLLTHEQYVKSVDECVKRAEQAEHTGLGRRAERIKKERDSGKGGT